MKVYSLLVVSNIQIWVINFNLKITDCSSTGKPKGFDGVELKKKKTKGKYEEAEWENQCKYFEVDKLITKVNTPYLLNISEKQHFCYQKGPSIVQMMKPMCRKALDIVRILFRKN